MGSISKKKSIEYRWGQFQKKSIEYTTKCKVTLAAARLIRYLDFIEIRTELIA
jgi:hypothetical protein